MRTLYSPTLAVKALAYAMRTANAAVNGLTVDLALYANNFRTVMFVVTTATMTDGIAAFKAQESDDNSTWADITADRIQGSLPTATSTDDDVVFSFGVVPQKRYLRLVATTAGATSGGGFSAVALLAGGSNSTAARS